MNPVSLLPHLVYKDFRILTSQSCGKSRRDGTCTEQVLVESIN